MHVQISYFADVLIEDFCDNPLELTPNKRDALTSYYNESNYADPIRSVEFLDFIPVYDFKSPINLYLNNANVNWELRIPQNSWTAKHVWELMEFINAERDLQNS